MRYSALLRRTVSPALALAVSLAAFTSVAAAEPPSWYEGSAGRRRISHLAAITVGGGLYLSSETFLKDDLVPSACRSCAPWGFDGSVREALLWDEPARAATLSNLSGYLLSPIAGLGLPMIAAFTADETDGVRFERWLDDAIPILESAVLSALVNQIVKLSVGRQRPFVHFGDPARPAELDDNLSFYSGHTTLTFAIATSAGVVAHRRGYRLEPLVWSAGYALAAATGYLRIAADKHYLTDVVTGAAAGAALGLAVPLLLHPHLSSHTPLGSQVSVVPTGNGLAVLGQF